MEYTKGEWKQGSHGDEPYTRLLLKIYAQDGRELAEAKQDRMLSFQEAEANARLIALSPRMATFIQRIVKQDGWLYPADVTAAKEILRTLANASSKKRRVCGKVIK